VRVTRVAPAFVGLRVPESAGARDRTLRLRLASTLPGSLAVSGGGVRKRTVAVGIKTSTVVVRVTPGTGLLTLRLALTAGGRTTRATATVSRS
jgi:hypothetical protein